MISEEEISRALDYLRDNASKDAQARAERLYTESWTKVVLAQEQAKADAPSMAAAQMKALMSDAYIAALDAHKAAVYEDERRRFLRDAAEARIEAWRTESATRRAEGKAYS